MTLRIGPSLRRSSAPTPWGDLCFVVDDQDVVVESWFGSLDDPREVDSDDARIVTVKVVPEVHNSVQAWLDGELDAILRVSVMDRGGPFQLSARKAMRGIRGGTVLSYAQLAAAAGSPRAVRAAGTACARNHVAPFIPCHRVVGSNGSLGGYAYGLEIKRSLLAHEGVMEFSVR